MQRGGHLARDSFRVLFSAPPIVQEHVKLSFILVIELSDLLEAVHYLRQVPTRVVLSLQRLVALERQLVVHARLRVVHELEFDSL